MSTGPAAVSFLVDAPVGWSADWAWGLPLIVLTILILPRPGYLCNGDVTPANWL